MAKCPNSRRKTIGPGGGSAGCHGVLLAVFQVPVTVPVKRIPRGGDQSVERMGKVLHAKTVRRGARVEPAEFAKLFVTGRYNVFCPTCGWSMAASVRGRSRR